MLKRRFALIGFAAVALVASSFAPVHAGNVTLLNSHPDAPYAIRATIVSGVPGGGSPSGVDDFSKCANPKQSCVIPGGTTGYVMKIDVFPVSRCISEKPPSNGPHAAGTTYNVPGELSAKRNFTVIVGTDGSVQVREP